VLEVDEHLQGAWSNFSAFEKLANKAGSSMTDLRGSVGQPAQVPLSSRFASTSEGGVAASASSACRALPCRVLIDRGCCAILMQTPLETRIWPRCAS
jgi:hypothetical protein